MDKIPTSVIGVLSHILPSRYTHSGINTLFLYAGAPETEPPGNKEQKVQAWLRATNVRCEEPLKVLGIILDDFMSKDVDEVEPFGEPSEYALALEAEKQKIRETLAKDSLAYVRGGTIVKSGSTSTISLEESVKRRGLQTVDIEIKRALAQIEHDPHAAAQYAGNVLEATLKAYLDSKSVVYRNADTLSELWKISAEQIGLRPNEWENKDLKKIASGLNSVVDGIMYFRNAKSAAHGKSEGQARSINIKPRHARLAIHAAHTVAAYVLELIE